MSSAGTVLLFVYGSLKRGLENHACLQSARFEGVARSAAAYRLLELHGYPALARQGSLAIQGELYRVPPAVLAALDAFEGGDYVRADLTLSDGRSAQTYFVASDAEHQARTLAGDVWWG